jgi:dihydrofolate reductase
MRRLIVFNSVTLDAYFTSPTGDMSWAHRSDPEWDAYVADNTKGESILLFGRVTYDMMASWWPSPNATKAFPVVAKKMNETQKFVFSRKMKSAEWQNTRVVNGDIAAEVRKMKSEPGPGMTILGSGTIVAQLTDANLIDEYQVVVNPVVLGAGRTMFDGVKEMVKLRLTSSRAFKNGNLLAVYESLVAGA